MKHFLVDLIANCKITLTDAQSVEHKVHLSQYGTNNFTTKEPLNFSPCEKFSFKTTLPCSDVEVSGECVFLKDDSTFQILRFDKNLSLEWARHFEKRLLSFKAKDVMSPSPVSTLPTTEVIQVAQMMRDIKAGSVVICDEQKKLLGIFTERDIMNYCTEDNFFDSPVSYFMTQDLATIEPESSLEDVYMTFSGASFRHLPVVDSGKIVGIISVRDLVQYWTKLLEIQKSNITKKYERTMSVIVHDLRSPIYAVRSINELILNEIEEPESFVEQGFPKLINDSCNNMVSLIDELLNVANDSFTQSPLEKQPCDLNNLINETVNAFRPSANEKNIDVQVETDSSITSVEVDERRFGQVIQNLTSNCIKYTNPESVVNIQSVQDNDGIYIHFIDHGQGIPKPELPRIFDEMCKISSKPTNNEPSTGLGLSIVKRLVEAHGGSISVVSEPNVETCFTVFLPQSEAVQNAA